MYVCIHFFMYKKKTTKTTKTNRIKSNQISIINSSYISSLPKYNLTTKQYQFIF